MRLPLPAAAAEQRHREVSGATPVHRPTPPRLPGCFVCPQLARSGRRWVHHRAQPALDSPPSALRVVAAQGQQVGMPSELLPGGVDAEGSCRRLPPPAAPAAAAAAEPAAAQRATSTSPGMQACCHH